MKINKLSSQPVTQIDYPKSLEAKASADLINQYFKYVDAKTKVKAGHTKSKAEVRGGGAKPWKQKGTGRARHGSSRSPIWRGGGITFGPRSGENARVLMNKKMRQKAFKALLTITAQEKRLSVADFQDKDEAKVIRQVISENSKEANSISLVVVDRNKSNLKKAANLANAKLVSLNRFGANQMKGKSNIVIEDAAMSELITRFK